MRITLGGLYNADELKDSFERLARWLQLNEVEEVKGVNVYLQPLRHRRLVSFVDEFGQEIEHVILDGPRRRPARALSEEPPLRTSANEGDKAKATPNEPMK